MADMNAADVLGVDWARRARELLAGARNREARKFVKTSIGPRGPRILENHDNRSPDEVAADVILGEGTGRVLEDLLTGFTPLPGAITEARGGKSGVLDWIPGAGILKGGVIAAPKMANILRGIVRTKSDDIVDMIRMVAEDAVERLRHAGHVPTREEINETVRTITDGMDDARGIEVLRKVSGDLTENTLNNASRAIDAGRVPSFDVKMPHTLDVNFQALDIDPVGWLERRSQGMRRKQEKWSDAYHTLSQDDKAAAVSESHDAVNAAAMAGITDSGKLRDIREKAYTRAIENRVRQAYDTPKRSDDTWGKLGETITTSKPESVLAAGRDAARRALEAGLSQGLSNDDAHRLASAARARAERQALASEGDAKDAILAQKRSEKKNLRVVYSMFSPEIQAEIARDADAARAAARQKYIDSGLDARKATVKSADAGNSARQKMTRKLVKEMGFKSVNDPRLQQYSILNRDGRHILADGTAVQQATPSGILSGALDITDNDRMMQGAYEAGLGERPLLAADRPVPYDTQAGLVISGGQSRLLPESDYSDADIAQLLISYGERPTGDAAFNREYAELLMKEQGY